MTALGSRSETDALLQRGSGLDPLDSVYLTHPQTTFIYDERPALLWRDGNQIGKSEGIAFFTVAFADRRLPVCRRWSGPFTILVIGYSYQQMDPLLGKIWKYLPKDRIDPKVHYAPREGFKGYKQQHVKVYATGECREDQLLAIIVLATYEAGPQSFMGITAHLVVMDEPPPAEVYGEAVSRVSFWSGLLRICFTPTPKSPPLGYMKKRVEKGELPEISFGVSAEVCTPRGGLVEIPFRTQTSIDAWSANLLAHEHDMRTLGAWFPSLEGRWLTQFTDSNVKAFEFGDGVGPPAKSTLGIGIDQGAAAGKQAVVLVAATLETTLTPRVWWIDEVSSDGYTTEEQDAKAILEMLDRNLGLLARRAGRAPYDLIDIWVGDRPTRNNAGRIKSNARLRRHLAAQLGRDQEKTVWIDTPEKYDGSVEDGARAMNSVFGRRDERGLPHGIVHPRAKKFIRGCREWRGDPKDPVKDVWDAGRYAFESICRPARWAGQIGLYG